MSRTTHARVGNEEAMLLYCLSSATAPPRQPVPTSIDWTRVMFLADAHGVAEPLAQSVASGRVNPPDEVRQVLQQRAIDATGANLARTRQVADLLKQLHAEGIRAASCKGPAFAVMAFGHLGRRASVDIDLLVHPADAPRVRPFMLSHGYQLPTRRRHRSGSLIYGLYPAAGRDDTLLPLDGNLAAVDVHVAFAYWTLGIRLDTPAMLDRAVVVDIAGRSVAALCPDDLVLVLAVHGMMHGWFLLRFVSDIDAAARLVSNWPLVIDRARTARLLRPLVLALTLARRTLHTELPDDVVALMSRDREAADLGEQCLDRLFDLDHRQRDWDPQPWFLSLQATRRDKMRFRFRSLIYEWLLKWPWDDWLGRRPPQNARDEA